LFQAAFGTDTLLCLAGSAMLFPFFCWFILSHIWEDIL
jgi:hypothetical protein